MQLFLIAGKAGTGKNKVAKIIKGYYESRKEKAVITEYSKYIKLFAKEMLDWDGSALKKPRTFLQEMGSFIREDLNHPDLFISRMQTDIEVYERFFKAVIIADVRYPEEIDKMKDRYPNVYAILVERAPKIETLSLKEQRHITEHALEDYQKFDVILENNDEEELKQAIYEFLETKVENY